MRNEIKTRKCSNGAEQGKIEMHKKMEYRKIVKKRKKKIKVLEKTN